MIVVRPIDVNDIYAFINLSFTARAGMTSMPKDRGMLEKKIFDSEKAFAKDVQQPGNENYLFVLEDLSNNAIEGICGINAKTGIDQPKYFFKIQNIEHFSPILSTTPNIPLLRVISYENAPSEICSLYLLPEFRKEGLGRLLSLSRFLFAASYLQRFDTTIYAEMRGFIDKNQICPFWEGMGRHFLNLDYTSLMHFRDLGNFDVTQVLPKHPLYISLLPKEVQEVIGKIHSNTWPAYHMLIEEGFYLTDDIDIFDAGPKIEAITKEIRSIKTSAIDIIAEITRNPIESIRYIVSNHRLDFRACYSTLQKDPKGIFLPAESAEALKVKVGDVIRYIVPSSDIPAHPLPLRNSEFLNFNGNAL
ncbi:MAG: arginine N-succinyltransferase [Parachlamydiaceae bacterium]|nr:arginine N-succinyltransferase [Parachlamydiaceae bacterium]